MSNKKEFKKMYDEKFSIEKNKKEILEKVNNNNFNIKAQTYFKWIIAPLCLILVVCFIVNRNSSNLTKFNNSKQKDNDNIINFNEINYGERYALNDIDGRYEERTFEELSKEFTFLKNIDDSYDETGLIERYERSDKTLVGYNKTIGYEAFYTLDCDKHIELFFSKTLKENPKCIAIPEDGFKISKIGGVEMKVLSYENNFNRGYEAIFKLNEVYFDIEFTNVSEKEFISFIESLVK